MKRVKFIYIYFLILILLVVGYFFTNPLTKIGIYEKIDQYMGIMIIPTLLFFLLYGFVFVIKDKSRRTFFEIKLYLIYIFVFFAVFLFILFKLGIVFSSVKTFSLSENFYKNLMSISLYDFKLGYLPTFIFYELLKITEKFKQYPFYYFYYALLGLETFLAILICFNPTRRYIAKSKKNKKARKKRAIVEARLKEQIKIKEDLEKREKIKMEKDRLRKEQLIQERVNDYRNSKAQKSKPKNKKKVDPELVKKVEGTKLKKLVTIEND